MTMILVCGGRDFACYMRNDKLVVVMPERNFIHDTLTACVGEDDKGNLNYVTILHGACSTGVDRVAQAWAERHMMGIKRRPAKWNTFGKAAGPKRNQEMVDMKPDYCLAFPSNGTGTADCAKRAADAGIPVFYPKY